MKLIIDIPEEKYERIIKDAQARMYHTNDLFELITILKNGTPLDDVKAEIEEYRSTIDRAISEDELKIEGMKEAYTDCLKIIDKYKAESEDT
jgi:hypothetical protein